MQTQRESIACDRIPRADIRRGRLHHHPPGLVVVNKISLDCGTIVRRLVKESQGAHDPQAMREFQLLLQKRFTIQAGPRQEVKDSSIVFFFLVGIPSCHETLTLSALKPTC